MGASRGARLCLLLLLAGGPLWVLRCRLGRPTPTAPKSRTAPSLLRQEMLQLVPGGLSQDAGRHGLSRDSSMNRGKPLTYSGSREAKPTKDQPRLCSQSLTLKVKADPRFGQLFRFHIPVLMWGQHFTPETWDRLKERSAPYGWHGLPYTAIASTLHLLNNSVNSRLFDRAGFPEGCVRCAVVGNGGILNGSRQGKEIDAHDFVFRLNGAVIKDFEDDVGTKTSFYGFTVNTMKNSLIAYREYGFTQIPQSKDLRYILIPSDMRDYVMLKSAILGSSVQEGYDKGDEPRTYFGPEASARKFRLLHPDFIHYLTAQFLRSEIINTQYGYLYMPSTGALMLLTALHTCDQVSAYGFITDNYRKFSDHYYEREKKPLVFYANHDMLLEAKLWKSLHRAGIMKLYQR
uniref:alpha-N-acetylgalactosaminide alpha-2,6-sialyltransferase n=1 Tax=Pelusios castaneus TaxID=367368 RepID=A0A8C8SW35_9SAUR